MGSGPQTGCGLRYESCYIVTLVRALHRGSPAGLTIYGGYYRWV